MTITTDRTRPESTGYTYDARRPAQSGPSRTPRAGSTQLSLENHSILDPSLTPAGEAQCRALSQHFPYHATTELIAASPLRRTIYTALTAFAPGLARGFQVLCLPEVQEISDLPCDTGGDLTSIKHEFSGAPVDFSMVQEGWQVKVSPILSSFPAPIAVSKASSATCCFHVQALIWPAWEMGTDYLCRPAEGTACVGMLTSTPGT